MVRECFQLWFSCVLRHTCLKVKESSSDWRVRIEIRAVQGMTISVCLKYWRLSSEMKSTVKLFDSMTVSKCYLLWKSFLEYKV